MGQTVRCHFLRLVEDDCFSHLEGHSVRLEANFRALFSGCLCKKSWTFSNSFAPFYLYFKPTKPGIFPSRDLFDFPFHPEFFQECIIDKLDLEQQRMSVALPEEVRVAEMAKKHSDGAVDRFIDVKNRISTSKWQTKPNQKHVHVSHVVTFQFFLKGNFYQFFQHYRIIDRQFFKMTNNSDFHFISHFHPWYLRQSRYQRPKPNLHQRPQRKERQRLKWRPKPRQVGKGTIWTEGRGALQKVAKNFQRENFGSPENFRENLGPLVSGDDLFFNPRGLVEMEQLTVNFFPGVSISFSSAI